MSAKTVHTAAGLKIKTKKKPTILICRSFSYILKASLVVVEDFVMFDHR